MSASIITATAHDTPARAVPSEPQTNTPPPSAAAPFEKRESWCDAYVSSLVAPAPDISLPADVRPTHHFETEFNACKLDPQEYARQTRDDGERTPETSERLPG